MSAGLRTILGTWWMRWLSAPVPDAPGRGESYTNLLYTGESYAQPLHTGESYTNLLYTGESYVTTSEG